VRFRRWLQPGIGVKRWLVVVFVGELLLALAGAFLLRQVYRDVEVTGPLAGIAFVVTLQFLPYAARAVVLVVIGAVLFGYGSYRVVRLLTDPFRAAVGDQPFVELIYQKRFLARGPRIVAIGGGTGLSTLLRGLKEHTSNLTAIVTVADDGGSSGALRESFGVPAVGDIRNCIVALADSEPLMGELLQYRFPSADGHAPAVATDPATPGGRPASGDRLSGHAVGNLLIAAMTAIEGGDFEEGVRQVNRVLAVRGRVVPVSPVPLTLHARLADGSELVGQSAIGRRSGIEDVWLVPPDVTAAADAISAIEDAEVIVIGPGSLFTSLLPALLVPSVREAIARSSAARIYVANVATQAGETSGFDLARHVEVLASRAPDVCDIVLADNGSTRAVPPDGWRGERVRLRWPPAVSRPPRLVLDDVVDPRNAHHHDPARLASAIVAIVERESGGRRRAAARTA
jgi:uncharacterized cofD-like protein